VGGGRPGNPLTPWLNPSNTALSAADSKSVVGSSTPVKGLIIANEDTLDSIPYGHQGNQSFYGPGGDGMISPGVDKNNPLVLVTTFSSTLSPLPSSTSTVLLKEVDPLSPSLGKGEDGEVSSSIADDEDSSDSEDKRWPVVPSDRGGDMVGGSEATESWWPSQLEKTRGSESIVGGGGGENNMWSDPMSGSESDSSASKPNNNLNAKSGLGVAKGVVTLSPTVSPTQFGSYRPGEEGDDEEHNKKLSPPGT